MKRNFQQGVALVITLILLSVITFLAITFLVLSQRERASVTGMTDQAIARFAAEAAVEHATAEVLAPILAYTNPLAFDLRVSTNYINPYGFTNGVEDFRNVSYADLNGQAIPITSDDYAQNIANLFYNPRPPVYIVTNRITGSNEFRYYLDLNRNGRYDTNGYLPELDTNGLPFLVPAVSDGVPVTVIASNFFVGDPEWIGVLERPDLPHSSTNRFTARYAYLVAPAGKTLDVNHLFNQAATRRMDNGPTLAHQGFLRNQGVGSWEINFPAFLRDLNTNVWLDYTYNPGGLSLTTTPFQDAFWFLNYRYGGYWATPPVLANYKDLRSVNAYFNGFADAAFQSDNIDGYSDDMLLMTNTWLEVEGVTTVRDVVNDAWGGADNTNHFFTTQDLFDPAKTSGGPLGFTNRLLRLGLQTSSYDRYTFYRLLAQLGTDSAPDPPGKMNLNYDNITTSAAVFYNWNPLVFFTNAAIRLLADAGYSVGIGPTNIMVTNAFGATNLQIQVFPTNFYTPSVHRLFQLAANIYDATTTNEFPSIFRPVLASQGNILYIIGFATNVSTSVDLNARLPKDLVSTNDVSGITSDDLVYGIPLVVGAKKGFPNFNEFSMRTVVSVARQLTFTKNAAGGNVVRTNQYYFIGISNAYGIEAWNSYTNSYPRALEVRVSGTNEVAISNKTILGGATNFVFVTNRLFDLASLGPRVYTSNSWLGLPLNPVAQPWLTATSFCVLSTNVVVRTDVPPAVGGTNSFPVPFWLLYMKARLQFAIVDTERDRIVDYVHPKFEDVVDLVYELTNVQTSASSVPSLARAVWDPRRMGALTYGITNQLNISLGNIDPDTIDDIWRDYSADPLTGAQKKKGIDAFRVFMKEGSPLYYPLMTISDTNVTMQSPFNPARKFVVTKNWEANDPLVHYLPSDMFDPVGGRQTINLKPFNSQPAALTNLGTINNRYQPWGGNPFKFGSNPSEDFDLSRKDPLVRRSDEWNFPTNKLATLGWLGRVHRGTPWQTIYLKPSPIALQTWTNWTGDSLAVTNWGQISTNLVPLYIYNRSNGWAYDAVFTLPTSDRSILDLFTTAINQNASRGRLSINQSGLAAWSAALSGVVVLSNTMTVPTDKPTFSSALIEPAGVHALPNSTPLSALVSAINAVRATNFVGGTFRYLADIVAVPELTANSPFLNLSPDQRVWGISDTVYEWLPQQLLSLLQVGEPRFVIYAYGQSLKPADQSIVTSGPYFGLCTNYQVTAEVATRSVVRVEGSPDPRDANNRDPLRRYPPRVVVESFNTLPPD